MAVTQKCPHGEAPLECLECYKAALLKRTAFNATQTNAGKR